MSLILEALRRSERERSALAGESAMVAVPTGYSGPGRRRRPRVSALAAGAAALLLLLALLWWLFAPSPRGEGAAPPPALEALPTLAPMPHISEQPSRIRPVPMAEPPVSAPVVPSRPAAPTPAPTPSAAPLLSPAAGTPEPAAEPEVVDLAAQLLPPPSRAPVPAPSRPQAKAPAPVPAPAESSGEADLAGQLVPHQPIAPARPAGSAAVAPAPPPDQVPAFAALPADFQASVPSLEVQVLFYSRDPLRRFVLVNGRRYRAGEELMSGLLLVGIERSGMVLEWHGQRFLMPAGGS